MPNNVILHILLFREYKQMKLFFDGVMRVGARVEGVRGERGRYKVRLT